MIAIQLLQVKDFMNKLLRTDLFDHFLLSEATIRGKGSYEIDGHLVPDFYSPEELDELEKKINKEKKENSWFDLFAKKVTNLSDEILKDN